MTERVYCNIASLPERVDSLKVTVDSILPQVDYLFVSLNGYDSIPKFLSGKNRIKCAVTLNEYGDASRFLGTSDYNGYVFTLDDDLSVPPGYVDYMISGIKKYMGIVSLHGKVMKPKPVHSFYHGFERAYMCLSQVNEDVKVDVVGSGICAWHTSFFNISPEDCPHPNMADVWMAKMAWSMGVDMWVLKHHAEYLKHVKHGWDVYTDNHKRGTSVLTETWNSF